MTFMSILEPRESIRMISCISILRAPVSKVNVIILYVRKEISIYIDV